MDTPKSKPTSPRAKGAREHLQRVHFLGLLAAKLPDEESKYRLAITAIYSCRAFAEILLEAADKQEFLSADGSAPTTRQSIESELTLRIPFYSLIERIRIHDFHRFGICPPDATSGGVFMGGPVRLKSQRGSAAIAIGENGIEQITEGSSSIKLMRPLLISNGLFFDDDSGRFVDLAEVLNAFLEKAPSVLEFYEFA